MKRLILLTGSVLLLQFMLSCKHQEKLKEKNSTHSYDELLTQNVVNQFINFQMNLKKKGKSELSYISQDSFPFYLQIISNAILSDLDTALINLEERSFSLQILPPQNGLYPYSYLSLKALELRDSIRNIIPQNLRVYNIEPFTANHNGSLTCRIIIGEPHYLAAGLGKAINPSTGLNYFSSTDQYRFGYGNEFKASDNTVYGGRPDYGATMTDGNGVVEEAYGKYVWYGGSATNSLPTTLNQKYSGAAKMLETYGQNNILTTYGWPSAAPSGYKYIYYIVESYKINVDYRKTFTKGNIWYNPNLTTNRTNQLFPSLVAAKFCVTPGDELLTSYHSQANPGWSVYQPIWLNATQLNYYLNQIPSIYNYIVNNNSILNGKVLYRFDVVPIYGGYNEINCGGTCAPDLFYSTNQWFTPFDHSYFPDDCIKVKYKHKYRFIFATRTLVPDPNPLLF